jgi:GNAT superfamily N-acetyltransferase
MFVTPPSPPSPLGFAPAHAKDAEALVTLRIAAMRDSLERIGRFDLDRARDRFLDGFEPQYTQHVEWQGVRVGVVVVKPQAARLVLDHLYIHPDRQRQGIGGAVLAHVCARADAEKKSIHLRSLRDSDSNHFYLHHGFELLGQGEFDNYYVRAARAVTT